MNGSSTWPTTAVGRRVRRPMPHWVKFRPARGVQAPVRSHRESAPNPQGSMDRSPPISLLRLWPCGHRPPLPVLRGAGAARQNGEHTARATARGCFRTATGVARGAPQPQGDRGGVRMPSSCGLRFGGDAPRCQALRGVWSSGDQWSGPLPRGEYGEREVIEGMRWRTLWPAHALRISARYSTRAVGVEGPSFHPTGARRPADLSLLRGGQELLDRFLEVCERLRTLEHDRRRDLPVTGLG
jgi:hypothetical protein